MAHHDLLVVLTSQAGMEAAIATMDLAPMALRADQTKVEQLVLIDQDTFAIGPVFYLDDVQPWLPIKDTSDPKNPVLFKPNILGPDTMLGREFIQEATLVRLEACRTGLPRRGHEAFSVVFEEFFNEESSDNDWNDWLFSEALDQLIVNRSDAALMASLCWLHGPGGDSLSRLQEFECLPLMGEHGEPSEQMHRYVSKIVPVQKRQAVLATLNSFYDR